MGSYPFRDGPCLAPPSLVGHLFAFFRSLIVHSFSDSLSTARHNFLAEFLGLPSCRHPNSAAGGAPSPTRAPALQLLGASANGCTEGFAHGVIIELIAALAMWPGVPFPADATLILPGLALHTCIGDERGDRVGRDRRIELHDERPADESGHRRDVANEIEIEMCVQCRVDSVRHADQQ